MTKTIRAEDIDTAIKMIENSKKPMILVGGGVVAADASKELKKFAEKIDAVVCDTLMGKGAFPGTDDRYTGMIGMHGTKVSNFGINQADLVIVVGARFSDRVTGNASKFANQAKLLHIDIDAAEINKNVEVDASVVGDAKEILKMISTRIKASKKPEWRAQIDALKEQYPDHADMNEFSGPAIINKIYELTEGNATITTDVGQHQMWATQYIDLNEKKRFITSGGLGTMGFGFPAAIGAKIGCPDKEVICITGDGGFQMNIQEFATAMCQETNIIVCVLNNYYLGMVRQIQQLFYGKRYEATCLKRRKACPPRCKGPGADCPPYEPDFVKLAESYGASGKRIEKEEEILPALQWAREQQTPVVLEFMIATEEIVLPMVKSGNPMSEMILK